MTTYNILLVFLLLLVVASVPAWRYSSGWGYYPAGGLGSILVLLIILRILGLI
jgi:hypothetical protein